MSSSVVNHLSLPLFSLTPQEYITKIGQYLLTLPQNFEPFTMQDNPNLIIALKYGKLPYLDEKGIFWDLIRLDQEYQGFRQLKTLATT